MLYRICSHVIMACEVGIAPENVGAGGMPDLFWSCRAEDEVDEEESQDLLLAK
jgi:hypothetical protein